MVHSEGPAEDTVTAGITGEGDTGTVAVPAGPGEYVVHPATQSAVMQMTRSTIAFGSIQRPWCQDLINWMLTAKFLAGMAACPAPVIPGYSIAGISRVRFPVARVPEQYTGITKEFL